MVRELGCCRESAVSVVPTAHGLWRQAEVTPIADINFHQQLLGQLGRPSIHRGSERPLGNRERYSTGACDRVRNRAPPLFSNLSPRRPNIRLRGGLCRSPMRMEESGDHDKANPGCPSCKGSRRSSCAAVAITSIRPGGIPRSEMGYSKWGASRQPEARSVSVHDRPAPAVGRRPSALQHDVSTTEACRADQLAYPGDAGLRRFCACLSSVRRAASRTNLASALASGSRRRHRSKPDFGFSRFVSEGGWKNWRPGSANGIG